MSLEKSRFYYKVYGLEVESEININEFVSIEDINAENKVNIVYANMPLNIKEDIKNNKKSSFSKAECWFHINDVATYRVTGGNLIEFEPC